MSYSRTEYAKLNIMYGYLRKVVLTFLEFFSRVIFIDTLGEEILGVNGVFINILQVLSLTELGIGNVVLYSFYQPLAVGDKCKLKSLILFYKKIYHKIAFAVLIIGIAIIPFLHNIINLHKEIPNLYIIYFLFLSNTIFSYFFIYKNSLLKADQKGYMVTKIEIPLIIIKIIIQILSLKLYSSFIIYLLIDNIMTLIINYSISKKVNKEYSYINDRYEELNSQEQKEIKNTIKSSFIYKVSGVILNSTDNILVSMIIGTGVVGYLVNYKTIYVGIASFYTVLFTSLTASIGNLIETSDVEHRFKIFNVLLLISSWLGIVLSSCFFILADSFIALWIGEKYILDTSVVLCISITIFMSCVLHPIFIYREAMGLYKKVKYVMLLAAIVNIILSIILGKIFGLVGILLGTIIATLITYVWYEPIVLYNDCFSSDSKGYFRGRIKDCVFFIILILILLHIKDLIYADSWIMWIIKAVSLFIVANIYCFIVYKNTKEFALIKNRIKQYY